MSDMTEPFGVALLEGGHANSLGRVNEVIDTVLHDPTRLEELYTCMFAEDAWVRMRAADAFEKICRQHPEWIEPYVDRMQDELSGDEQQASIQWHLAQMYQEVLLSDVQKQRAVAWLAKILASSDIDWIVAANAMEALAYFVGTGDYPKQKLLTLLDIQLGHKSSAVVKRATKLIAEL
jgi:TPR repeat protein